MLLIFFTSSRNELYNPLCSNKATYKLCFKYLARKKNPKVVPSSKLGVGLPVKYIAAQRFIFRGKRLDNKTITISNEAVFLVIAFHAAIDLLSILRASRSRNRIYGRFHG